MSTPMDPHASDVAARNRKLATWLWAAVATAFLVAYLTRRVLYHVVFQ
jgi:hypothetical protein